jgi:hypothetical protein
MKSYKICISRGNRGKIGMMFSQISNVRWAERRGKSTISKRRLIYGKSLGEVLEEET